MVKPTTGADLARNSPRNQKSILSPAAHVRKWKKQNFEVSMLALGKSLFTNKMPSSVLKQQSIASILQEEFHALDPTHT